MKQKLGVYILIASFSGLIYLEERSTKVNNSHSGLELYLKCQEKINNTPNSKRRLIYREQKISLIRDLGFNGDIFSYDSIYARPNSNGVIIEIGTKNKQGGLFNLGKISPRVEYFVTYEQMNQYLSK